MPEAIACDIKQKPLARNRAATCRKRIDGIAGCRAEHEISRAERGGPVSSRLELRERGAELALVPMQAAHAPQKVRKAFQITRFFQLTAAHHRRMFAVRNHRCVPHERNMSGLGLDRSNASSYVASALSFRGRRGQKQLLGTEPAQQALVPRTLTAMTHDERDLGLMHRVDHRRRGTCPSERVTDLDHIREARSLSAELMRHQDAQQMLRARRCERLMRKPGFPIDCDRGLGGNPRDGLRPIIEICGWNMAVAARDIGGSVTHNPEILNRDASSIWIAVRGELADCGQRVFIRAGADGLFVR